MKKERERKKGEIGRRQGRWMRAGEANGRVSKKGRRERRRQGRWMRAGEAKGRVSKKGRREGRRQGRDKMESK